MNATDYGRHNIERVGVGTVGETCCGSWCRKPVALRHVGRDYCLEHWEAYCLSVDVSGAEITIGSVGTRGEPV